MRPEEPAPVATGRQPAAEIATELTPIGEQFVIPGCERDATRGPKQGSLWE